MNEDKGSGRSAITREQVRELYESHWRSPGYTCPHALTYPWMWLWDSCFHALVWAELGEPDRAVTELRTALSGQDGDGFVPHMGYFAEPELATDFWGRRGYSSITQPPVYGHTVAALIRRGVRVPDELVEASGRGLWFLLTRRRRSAHGLVELVHPWESGADNSPRWDDACPGGFDLSRWREAKGRLLATVRRSPGGAPLHNPMFAVGSVAFSALVSFCATELAGVTGDPSLAGAAADLAKAIDRRWDAGARTWVDDGFTSGGSGSAPTAEGLLGVLVTTRGDAVDSVAVDLEDPTAHGGRYGPTGVRRDHVTFRPGSYWRGPSWPQLNYLLWLGLRRQGRLGVASRLASATVSGAAVSGFAEYWDADRGTPGGAAPQSWSALALVMDEASEK